jgi:Patatin-like phospholipase
MSADEPLLFDDVLATEYTALRPGGRFEGSAAELVAAMHHDPEPLSALCVSGGGIRSATFALGVIQGLAERGLLPQFDYLSTVSGGGYIGSWLTAWSHRTGGIDHVAGRLGRDAAPPPPGEPDPIQHLRAYNSYLSPRRGAFSTDLWTLVATILRNIVLNWLVLIPLVVFVVIVPRLYLSALSFPEQVYGAVIFADGGADYSAEPLDAIARSPLVVYVLPLVSLGLFAIALFNTLRYLPGVGGRDHSAYDFAVAVLAPLVASVLAFLLFDSLYFLGRNFADHTNLAWVVGWSILPCAVAWGLYLLTDPRPAPQRARLLFGPLSLAIVAMAAGTGAATWATTNYVLWNPDQTKAISWAAYVTLGPPLVLLGFCFASTLFVGLSSLFLEDGDREWMSRAVAGVLLFTVAWGGFCAMVLVLPQWALAWRSWVHGLLGAAAGLSAWLSTTRSAPAGNVNPGTVGRPPAHSTLGAVAARVAAPLFIALLAGALSIVANLLLVGAHQVTGIPLVDAYGQPVNWRNHYGILAETDIRLIAVLAVACLGFTSLMSRYVNINTFSLQGMYRARLVRAYLGASNPHREASTFTGFGRADDLPLAALDSTRRPLHVVNVTLNLVAGQRLAWQERKAESFTMTATHCGSLSLGYRRSSEYGGGITLGTAVAISGAAASPNMGYHSSPLVGFIMTLFNARLGSWLGNPGRPGRRTWTDPAPRSATGLLVREALLRTTDRRPYVYLSDGGHFENLALYEMVRRRCRMIVVIDGGCDPDFQYADLGNALRKIRIDLRIPIDFEDTGMSALRARSRRCAIGRVRYSAVDGSGTDGTLVYVKPMLLGTEPPDVTSYAASAPTFPHQSTADQWFDESQTESYRMLGLQTVDEMCSGWTGEGFADFRRHLETVYLA